MKSSCPCAGKRASTPKPASSVPEMLVESVNDGPLTLVVDTDQLNA